MRYAKLEGRIKELYGSQKQLAVAMGVNQSYISSRLTGKVPFDVSEISAFCKALRIPIEEAHKFFFE